jgi:cell division transport system permease protein
MALKLDHVIGETATNLRRNILMSTAAIITVAVSLSLVGGVLLLRQGVTKATMQWRGGVSLSVYMNPDASPQQISAIDQELKGMPEVKSFTYVDKPAAFKEAQKLFAADPVTLSSLSVEKMPPSFRIVPTSTSFIDSIGSRFNSAPGVERNGVVYAKKEIQTMVTVTHVLQAGLLIVALVLLGSATLLILNAIRIAIFARRREVAVMKLVGATNWFIRIPFMLEGMLQGLIGAAIAFGLVLVARTAMYSVSHKPHYELLEKMVVTTHEAIGTGFFVLGVGIVVGVSGSVAAVHRFLDI